MEKKIILAIFVLFIFGFFFWQGIYLPKTPFGEEKLFLVEKGQSLFQIAENLEKEGLIKNKFFFDFYIFIKGVQRKLQAGEYFLMMIL